jgi:hypothetical protein
LHKEQTNRNRPTETDQGEKLAGGADAGSPPAHTAPDPLDHDPTNALEANLARRVAGLAGALESAPAEILLAISWTPDGKFLDHIRSASPEWLATTLAVCDRFEAESVP